MPSGDYDCLPKQANVRLKRLEVNTAPAREKFDLPQLRSYSSLGTRDKAAFIQKMIHTSSGKQERFKIVGRNDAANLRQLMNLKKRAKMQKDLA